jgi:hypothetical protein
MPSIANGKRTMPTLTFGAKLWTCFISGNARLPDLGNTR